MIKGAPIKEVIPLIGNTEALPGIRAIESQTKSNNAPPRKTAGKMIL